MKWKAPELLAPMAARRQQTLVRLVEAVQRMVPEWTPSGLWKEQPRLLYAAMHHLVPQLSELARARDLQGIRRLVDLVSRDPATIDTAAGPLLCWAWNRGTAMHQGDSDIFVLGADAVVTTSGIPEGVVQRAVSRICMAGWNTLAAEWMGILVALEELEDDAVARAYSLTALPCTIHLDWVRDPARLGEFLIHECGHSWLNDALATFGEDLNTTQQWYSPWRGCDRPAFGIVHAAVAFSVVVLYYERLLRRGDPGDVEMARQRLAAERSKLVQARDAIEQTVDLLRTPALTGAVTDLYTRAMAADAQ